MSNLEILAKAIKLAIKGGFDENAIGDLELGTTGLIFNHEFAKSLWGTSEMHSFDDGHSTSYPTGIIADNQTLFTRTCAWKYHLQQMVIADDPLAYLAANLPE